VYTLRRFSEDSSKFATLISDNPQIPPLDVADTEMMWALLDYSTMSSAAPVEEIENPEVNFWFDINTSWYDLFGGMNTLSPHDVSQVAGATTDQSSLFGVNGIRLTQTDTAGRYPLIAAPGINHHAWSTGI
jgi:hypothetical protein